MRLISLFSWSRRFASPMTWNGEKNSLGGVSTRSMQPMTECEVYSLENGTYGVVRLSYSSEFGRLNLQP